MEKKEIIELSILITLGVLIAIYYFIKAIKNHWFKKLIDTVNNACGEAEELYKDGYKMGIEKKMYVQNAIKGLCSEEGIPYFLIARLIDKHIDKIIAGYNAIKGKTKST